MALAVTLNTSHICAVKWLYPIRVWGFCLCWHQFNFINPQGEIQLFSSNELIQSLSSTDWLIISLIAVWKKELLWCCVLQLTDLRRPLAALCCSKTQVFCGFRQSQHYTVLTFWIKTLHLTHLNSQYLKCEKKVKNKPETAAVYGCTSSLLHSYAPGFTLFFMFIIGNTSKW